MTLEAVTAVGQSVNELSTPAVVIDLDQMERNLADMQDFCNHTGIKLRPHSKTHKTPELALKQMEFGAVGVCTQKISEAKVMVDNGVKNVFLSNEVIDPKKLKLFAELSEKAEMMICVDSPDGIQNLWQTARDSGHELNCIVDIDCGMQRCGVQPENAGTLAAMVSGSKNLVFKGIMGYEGHIGGDQKRDQWPAQVKEAMEKVSRAKKEIRKEGLEVEKVIVGGTPTAKLSGTYPDVTEITPGEYIFYDWNHARSGLVSVKDVAISVVCTVMSRPVESRAVIDGGLKTFDYDASEYPIVRNYDNLHAKFIGFSEEHGKLNLEDERARREFQLGKKFEFVPYHVCTCVNLQNTLYYARHGKVEKALPVLGRGMVS
jgi:D-serine deaminase-like pyridoxal phosphate-dependent protein